MESAVVGCSFTSVSMYFTCILACAAFFQVRGNCLSVLTMTGVLPETCLKGYSTCSSLSLLCVYICVAAVSLQRNILHWSLTVLLGDVGFRVKLQHAVNVHDHSAMRRSPPFECSYYFLKHRSVNVCRSFNAYEED